MEVADVEVTDADIGVVRVTGKSASNGKHGSGAAGDCSEVADLERKRAAKADVVEIASDSGSSSSDSESSSRSRSRQRSKCVGAAAATALMTSVQPLDVDEPERAVERELVLPTGFVVPLQHEGGLVAIMVETGAQICVLPRNEDPNESVVRLSGSEHAVGRAVSSLELAHSTHKQAEAAASAAPVLAQVEIPAQHLNAVVGPNGQGIAEVRSKCAGIMIAVQPSEQPGGPVTAFIGPSDKEQVVRAEREIRERLLLAEAAASAASAGAADGADAAAAKAAKGKEPNDVVPNGAAKASEPPPAAQPRADAEAGAAGVAPAQGAAEGRAEEAVKGDGADSEDLDDIP